MTSMNRASTAGGAGPLSATITSMRNVVSDGWYNQATDLAQWKRFFWLAYRRGTKHGPNWADRGANSFGVILRSNDLCRWHEAMIFQPPDGVADGSGANCPRFVPDGNRLYVFFSVHRSEPLGTYCHTYSSWTEDGVQWSQPRVCRLDDGFPFLWRVRRHDGCFYSPTCFPGQKAEHEDGPLELLASDDGTTWRHHSRIDRRDPVRFTEEADLHWLADGTMWCIVRALGSARFYTSQPPYQSWDQGIDLGLGCDAPAFCAASGQVFVAGRARMPGVQPVAPTTGLYHVSPGKISLMAWTDRAEDISYPGLISPEPGKLVMSYYSDGPYALGKRKPRYFDQYKRKHSDCDIFLAEIELTEQT